MKNNIYTEEMHKTEFIQFGRYQEIKPRQFLRYCFEIDNLSFSEALEEETDFGYCTKSVRLLAKILGFRRKTIREWGDNPNFEGMPQHARMTCNYAFTGLSKEELNQIIYTDSQAPSINAKQFISEIFLKNLSPEEKFKIISSTKFRGQYLNLLSRTLKVSKVTIYQWGRDMELKNMPKHYQYTLAYALTAYKKQEAVAKQGAA